MSRPFDALSDTLLIFAGVAVILVIATVIAEWLRYRARGGSSPVLENLSARIRAWWVMVALIGVAFVFGRVGVNVLFFFVSMLALREFITLLPTRRGDYYSLVVAFYVVVPYQYWLVYTDWYGMYTLLIPAFAFLVLPILAALGGDTTHYLERTAKVQWGLMISVFCVSHVPALLNLEIVGYEGRNLLLIAFLVLVVQSGDVLQYIWGKLLGRRKVAPALSPQKTVEGLVGGVASATLLGAALFWITPFTWWQAGLLALVSNLMGFWGGLVMSAIKRDRGIKDWGHTIEGHGGVLDRIDSVCFAAPIFFHLIHYFWVP